MKRVKNGFQKQLTDGTSCMVAYEHAGKLRIEKSVGPNSYDEYELTAAQCEMLGMTAALEDVPEPWERLRSALHSAVAELGTTMEHPVYQLPSDVLVRAAELLGIEPEGE